MNQCVNAPCNKCEKAAPEDAFYTIQRMQIVQLKKCVIPKQIQNQTYYGRPREDTENNTS